MENNYKFKTLENLEKKIWQELDADENSYLIVTCNRLRKKPLNDFSIEDLRIMIGQNIGLDYLIPIATEKLNENILAEGDFYEGDLLNTVLESNIEYWKNHKENYSLICDIFQRNESLLKELDTTWEIKKNWFESFKNFKSINKTNN
ncbi:contact-dependent growth inhibition system immunity protein [Chryseobacterium formosus]|uniref:Contact-dependent growth inhibition system immunity protein n=1 Tax=Chryseobacterium formosus TaxID=1537363 RepID=A0ABT3XTN6_9FLAO|nr:contact-dependent growth inhibition system immunity protein [Chryseobacterium formosus]MCX8523869.1 contact-dependent growth inhibition system immunity protein [Chryseobacterium formosus]